MIVQYELPYNDSTETWNVRVEATSRDQIALLDPKQDRYVVGIAEIRDKEALLFRDLQVMFEVVNFLEMAFEARIKYQDDARNAISVLRTHHGLDVPTGTKWEYTILTLGVALPPLINFTELGKKGWELVAVDEGIAYFKRPYV